MQRKNDCIVLHSEIANEKRGQVVLIYNHNGDMAQDSHEELKCEVRKVGYHEDRAKQFKTHLKMDEETYRKTVDGVLDYILKLNPKISLDEAIYFCGALESEVNILLEAEQKQVKGLPLASLRTK